MGGAARRRVNRVAAAPAEGGACSFCGSEVQDESTVGLLYTLESTTVHYYCVLLSCCLVQRGEEEEGLFGFLLDDILAEIQRGKKQRCSYCAKGGATLGCSVGQCRKQFHLPCGRRRGAVSLFYGNYKSFCIAHAPKQDIPDAIMAKARARKAQAKKRSRAASRSSPVKTVDGSCADIKLARSPFKQLSEGAEDSEPVCVICYEEVCAWPAPDTFWPPCCARDSWFHTPCLQRMALSAGAHYLKCPLCNDREVFQREAARRGVYVPDRDAAWELEEDAFAELYERGSACVADECGCYQGREYDADSGRWELRRCVACGGAPAHAGCLPAAPHVCARCSGVAPPAALEALERVPLAPPVPERAASPERRPLMSHRMSLRRTKQRHLAPRCPPAARRAALRSEQLVRLSRARGNEEDNVDIESVDNPVPSSSNPPKTSANPPVSTPATRPAPPPEPDNTKASRLSLGLRSPKPRFPDRGALVRELEERILSPLKFIEERIYSRLRGAREAEYRGRIERGMARVRRPGPRSVKRRMIGDILEGILADCADGGAEVDPGTAALAAEGPPQGTEQKTSETSRQSASKTEHVASDKEAFQMSPSDHSTPAKAISIEQDYNSKCDSSTAEDISPVKDLPDPKSVDEGDEILHINNDEHNNSLNSSNTTFELAPDFLSEEKDESFLDTSTKVEIEANTSLEICDEDNGVYIWYRVVDSVGQGRRIVEKDDNKCKIRKRERVPIESNDVINVDLENQDAEGEVLISPTKILSETDDKHELPKTPKSKNIDNTEMFKSHYLSEVDRSVTFKCNFNHKHESNSDVQKPRLRTPIDFAIEAAVRKRRETLNKSPSESEKELFMETNSNIVNNNEGKKITKRKIELSENSNKILENEVPDETKSENAGVESTVIIDVDDYEIQDRESTVIIDVDEIQDGVSPKSSKKETNIAIDNEYINIKSLKQKLKRKLNGDMTGPRKKSKLTIKEPTNEGDDRIRNPKQRKREEKRSRHNKNDAKEKIWKDANKEESKINENSSKLQDLNIRKDKIDHRENHGFVDELSAINDFYIRRESKKKKKKEKKRENRDKHSWKLKKLLKRSSPEGKVLKQSILNFSPESKKLLSTPREVCAKKRKKMKAESPPDGLKQTNLKSFFSLHLTLT